MVIAMALASPIFAQEQTPVTSLQELLDQLESSNPEVRAARFRFEAATKRPSQVSTLPEPKLTLANVGVGQPFSRLGVSEFAYRGIGISQEVPFPGKLGLAAEEAKREADSERQNYRAIVLEKASQLKMAYYDWYFATKAIEITSKNRDLLDRLEQIARARYAVGKGIQPDVLKAQVEVSGLIQQIELLQQKKLLTEARIRSLLNSEVPLGRPDGLAKPCVVNCDNLRTIPRLVLKERISKLSAARIPEVKRAVGYALGWEDLIEA